VFQRTKCLQVFFIALKCNRKSLIFIVTVVSWNHTSNASNAKAPPPLPPLSLPYPTILPTFSFFPPHLLFLFNFVTFSCCFVSDFQIRRRRAQMERRDSSSPKRQIGSIHFHVYFFYSDFFEPSPLPFPPHLRRLSSTVKWRRWTVACTTLLGRLKQARCATCFIECFL
jgi:hypothetical protein